MVFNKPFALPLFNPYSSGGNFGWGSEDSMKNGIEEEIPTVQSYLWQVVDNDM